MRGHVVGLLMLGLGLGACGSDGGSKEGDPSSSSTSTEGPTYHRDVAPVLVEHCGACHTDGGIAPFSVYDAQTASDWAAASLDAVTAGRMPPFFAKSDAECTPPLPWQHDPTLSDEKVQLLTDWVDAGAPLGKPQNAAAVPDVSVEPLSPVNSVVKLQQPFTVDGTGDIYQCFRIPLPVDEDAWLTGLEVFPDNDLVVHHVLVWSDPKDLSAGEVGDDESYKCAGDPGFFPTELVAIWTPGGSPMIAPENSGTPVHPGGSLVVNVHYHPTGNTTEVDQTEVALQWTTEKPANYVTWYLVDIPFGADVVPAEDPATGQTEDDFLIPAGASEHVETVQLYLPSYIPFEMPVFAVTPHMHYLGTDMLVTIDHGDSDEDTCLIHTPGYRFDFQTSYVYDGDIDALPTVKAGDRVNVRCTYDNSSSNPFSRLQLDAAGISAPEDVFWGEETSEEMCMAMVGLILPPIEIADLF
jgi:hypothetical protein